MPAASSSGPPASGNGTPGTARGTGRSSTSSAASSSRKGGALKSVYYKSYEEHFASHPEGLDGLLAVAKRLRNPHAEATTGVDLQVPAIMTYLERHGLVLRGEEVVDIGSWEGRASHPISIRLSPLTIRATGEPKLTLEQFWQRKKCLAVWDEGSDGGTTT